MYTETYTKPLFRANYKMTKLIVHVIHAKYLENRVGIYQMLLMRLKEAGILEGVNVITDKDPIDIVANDVFQSFTRNNLPNDDKLAYYNGVIKPLGPTQLSNCLKHKLALEAVAACEDDSQVHLVVEDDILFNDSLPTMLEKAIKMSQNNAMLDAHKRLLMFLGVPSAATEEVQIRKVLDTFRFLPCCDSFLINNLAARAILQHFVPMRFPVHLQLTYAMARSEGFELCMIAPNIFIDGTKLGALPSNVELNNRLVFNAVYNKLKQLIDGLCEQNKEDSKAEICKLFEAFEYKSNPEYAYLKARYEAKKGNYDFALALYKHSFKQYEALGTPLSQGSEFMKDYMMLYRELQD